MLVETLIILIIIWRICLMFTGSIYPEIPFRKSKNEFSIVTYNIQSLPHYYKDITNLYDKLCQYDIICLQECFQSVWFNYSRLYKKFSKYFYIVRGTMTTSSMKIIDSGLVIMSKYPLFSTTFTPFTWYRGRSSDSLAEKGFLKTEIGLPIGKLGVICTHLQASYTIEQENVIYSKKQLKEIFRRRIDSNIPIVIAGDFNMIPEDSKSVIPSTSYTISSGECDTTYILYDDKDGSELRTDSFSFHSKAKGYKLDYFIHTKDITIRDIETTSYSISDHSAVSAIIEKIDHIL